MANCTAKTDDPRFDGPRPDFTSHVRDVLYAAVAKDPKAAAALLAPLVIERAQLVKDIRMADKFPNLSGVAGAIDKLTHAIEDDAKAVLAKIEEVAGKRTRVFNKAQSKIVVRDAALDEADQALDKLDAALGDNGGPPLPTSGG